MADIIDGLRNAADLSKHLSERAAESNLSADEIAKYRGQHLRTSPREASSEKKPAGCSQPMTALRPIGSPRAARATSAT